MTFWKPQPSPNGSANRRAVVAEITGCLARLGIIIPDGIDVFTPVGQTVLLAAVKTAVAAKRRREKPKPASENPDMPPDPAGF